MKTNEQIKQEIVNYLTKTSYHLFNYNNGIFKVYRGGDRFYIIDTGSNFNKVKEIDINRYVSNCGSNAKCVLKHSLFLGKEVTSVKNTQDMRSYVDGIYQAYDKTRSNSEKSVSSNSNCPAF
jgi:hypothetical protein